jgi:hypothetical protein
LTYASTINWLLEGDPVIRWQTMRDLLAEPEDLVQAERQKLVSTGWGAQFLQALLPDATWPEGRWTGTVWTLLTLIDCGMPATNPHTSDAARQFLQHNLTAERAASDRWLLTQMDLCHLGFWLRIGATFIGKDERLLRVAETLLRQQMQDGGWNCRTRTNPKTHHSSFHTTFNVLEGLRAAASAGIVSYDRFRLSESLAMEFMLRHRMFRSDHTGSVIDERFMHLTFPSYWHYTVLRGLDYMRHTPEIGDPRLNEAISLLESRRRTDGFWPVEKRIAGSTLFDMERVGGVSRWNTLRVLRVLKCRNQAVGILDSGI